MAELIIVGSGIKAGAHMTLETRSWIESADIVLYLVADPVTEHQINTLNSNTRSLFSCYREGQSRYSAYRRMIDAALSAMDEHAVVCAVFYGHPGVFVYPTFKMIEEVRQKGHKARMLPAISADACLYADLQIDPARDGCQNFEATDFLLQERVFDVRSLLILWQIGMIGDFTFKAAGYDNDRLSALVERLCRSYPDNHEVIVYEAAQFGGCEPKIQRRELLTLAGAPVTAASTLVVLPARREQVRKSRLAELGLSRDDVIVER